MHYFALPLPQGQRAPSFRATEFLDRRKRKRGEGDGYTPPDSPVDEAGQSESDTAKVLSQAISFASLSAEQADEYRAAGLSPDDKLPPYPFPHAPVSAPLERFSQARLQKQLASLNPPLYLPSRKAKGQVLGQKDGSLLRKHLGVVTAIMHRSLLRRDYERAGRAWGTILRAQIDGKYIDVRDSGYWGIGAEILLRTQYPKQLPQVATVDTDDSSVSTTGGISEAPREMISPEGHRAARAYYQRLILQHNLPQNQVDSTHFYPALFSVWINEVSEGARIARSMLIKSFDQRSVDSGDTNPTKSSQIPRSSGDTSKNTSSNPSTLRQLEEIRKSELKGALEIATHLDGLLVSPPMDKDAYLLQLRGMVALWIGELLIPTKPQDASTEDEDEFSASSAEDQAAGSDPSAEARGKADRVAEMRRASQFFKCVRENGGLVWEGVAHLLEDEDE